MGGQAVASVLRRDRIGDAGPQAATSIIGPPTGFGHTHTQGQVQGPVQTRADLSGHGAQSHGIQPGPAEGQVYLAGRPEHFTPACGPFPLEVAAGAPLPVWVTLDLRLLTGTGTP